MLRWFLSHPACLIEQTVQKKDIAVAAGFAVVLILHSFEKLAKSADVLNVFFCKMKKEKGILSPVDTVGTMRTRNRLKLLFLELFVLLIGG